MKEPGQPDAVPKGSYDQIQAQNLRLLVKNEELGVKFLVASQEKVQLSHKLKMVQLSHKLKKIEEINVVVVSIPYTLINIPAPAIPVPLTITLPGPIPYSNEKVVPWHYGSDVYYHGVKQEEKPFEEMPCVDENLNVDNLVGRSKITRRGRVFPSQNTQDSDDALAKAKGKKVMEDNQESVQIFVPKQSAMPGTSSS
ncbi:hypothetical protein KIW84_012872 [Lathyrus oleraceus]|uniref:Uncharacterized protein n=1 Tax=Pisum sativum TaxID=3888 RepID=A0A9D5GX97_PEA|nr:hypothetical protein KIW84_012872 [Pisum sativum]